MHKPRVDFVEIVNDAEMQKKEKQATKAVRRFYPNSGPVKLYRTADGRIGFQMQIAVASGERRRLDEIYHAVMRVLGEKRGRRAGLKTVQTKLRLPEPVYSALKKAASDSHSTMSSIAAESLRARFQGGQRLP